jgi:CheY-like chemotaxis protein
MNVLVADDDADIREVTAHFLGRRGWAVTTVASGLEASAALQGEGYDVAVLDQNMPPGSGMEVAAERRQRGDSVPIVLWTGWAGTLDLDEVQRLDVHVLNKADVRKLSSLVEELARG